jgi:predicted SAM-dependent methyltransferase
MSPAVMNPSNYLNVGCGAKFHESWTNVDMHSSSPYVQSCNLLKGFPYADNRFDVVYHSQVLEHFSKDDAIGFLTECMRVLKPGGVLRVVVPDLESIAKEYLRHLNENLENPGKTAEANYDWILLEMYDQTVRNHSGGQMAEFLSQPDLINEEYVIQRSGIVGSRIIENSRQQGADNRWKVLRKKIKTVTFQKLVSRCANRLANTFATKAQRIGAFRLGGEVHMWMYDRFSLSRLLSRVGFVEIKVLTPFESKVPNWGDYELDVKDGVVFDPASLFMEATKPGLRDLGSNNV